MKMQVTAYYNREPAEIVVEKPEGEWMKAEGLLKLLGFRQDKRSGEPVGGSWRFKSFSKREIDQVRAIVRVGCGYLTCANAEESFSV